jgi:hypothetical protein
VKYFSKAFFFMASLLTPVMPLFLFVLFWDKKIILHYADSLRKIRIHLEELSKGPVKHYLEDVFLREKNIPVQIQGSCTQCGNCCLNKQCFFLKEVENNQFQCGIYDSFWRRFSNCNSYPLHAKDIERYACPGFSVIHITPVTISRLGKKVLTDTATQGETV